MLFKDRERWELRHSLIGLWANPAPGVNWLTHSAAAAFLAYKSADLAAGDLHLRQLAPPAHP